MKCVNWNTQHNVVFTVPVFTWGPKFCGLWQERAVHLESVRFNARSHQHRSAKSTCLLPAAAVQTPYCRGSAGLMQRSRRQCPLCEASARLIPRNSSPGFKRSWPNAAPPPPTAVSRRLCEAPFILQGKGKHRNLGSHVPYLSIRTGLLFLQHVTLGREQVTHLSRGPAPNQLTQARL